MDVSFNGIWLSTFGIVMDYSKDIIPPRTWSSYEIPARDGAFLGRKTIEPREFQIDLKLVGEVEDKRRALAAILETDGPAPLVFSTQSDITFYAVFTGESDLDPEAHTADVTLTFFVPDPYGIGQQQQHTITGSTTAEIYTQGDADTYPIIRAEFATASTFFSISNDENQFILIGESASIGDEILPYEELILHDPLATITGWQNWGGVPDGGGVHNGVMASTGWNFRLSDVGSGTGWHGAAVVKTLPEPVQDFLIDFQATQRSTDPKQVGRVQFYLLDVNGQHVARLEIRDGDLTAYTNSGYVQLGQGGTSHMMTSYKSTRLNNFNLGHLRLRRNGLQFSSYISKNDPQTGAVITGVGNSYFDTGGIYQAPIAQVVIAIAGYGTSPISHSYADDIRIYRLNQPTNPASTVDLLFKAGDVLEINTWTGSVTINGTQAIGHLNPQSDFFKLRAGTNTIGIAANGDVTTAITYATRWN